MGKPCVYQATVLVTWQIIIIKKTKKKKNIATFPLSPYSVLKIPNNQLQTHTLDNFQRKTKN